MPIGTGRESELGGAIFNSVLSSTHSCYVSYYPANGNLYLYSDSGALTGPIQPGSGTLKNSQCTINGSGTTVTLSGTNLTLNLAVTLSSTDQGQQSVYMSAYDKNGASVGWTKEDSWMPDGNPTPTVVSVSPTPATGLSNTFVLTYSDANGATALNLASVNFSKTTSTANACYAIYVPGSNRVYLENDAGTGVTGPMYLGTSGTLSNSQCSINLGTSSATLSGVNLTLNLAVTASSTYKGAQNIYMSASNTSGASTGWLKEGTWMPTTSTAAPTFSVSPNPATGASPTFALKYTDPNGTTDLTFVGVIFNSQLSGVNSCYVAYYPGSNTLYLENDGGTALSGPISPGSGTLSNGQCSINGGGTSVSTSGDTLTLNLAVTASAAYMGQQVVWMTAYDSSGGSAHWTNEGSWMP